MPDFKYKIRDNHGRPSVGIVKAGSRELAAAHFKEMGYAIVSIEESSSASILPNPVINFFNRVSFDELIVFTRQLMTLLRAGVPILVSLESIREQLKNVYFKRATEEICREIESGKSLSESFSKFPDIFSDIYISMMHTGEAGGILDEVLDRLAGLLEREQDLRMKVSQATRYPLLVILAICLAFPALVMFILPKFSFLFARFNTELPLPTKILLGINFLLTHYWAFVIIVIIGLIIAFIRFINTASGRYAWDAFKLRLPVFGDLFLKISMARFSRLTALLTASGIPIINTLETVKGSLGNSVIAGSMDVIISGINEGKGIAGPMKSSGLFPSIVIQMVRIGEETGKLDELLLRVADYYDSQIDYKVKNLTVLIEPILIFVLGIMVLTMALAIFMPMWNLISVFKH